MMLHLFDLAKRINPDGTPFISEGWCVALQPVIILFGSIPRFALNEFRHSPKDGEKPMSSTIIAFGLACYAAASAVFVLTTYSVVHLALSYDGPDRAPNTTPYDKDVLVGLLLAQIGYPVVTYYSLLYLHVLYPESDNVSNSASYPATLSFIKDVAYSTLDVLTKAGMAFYTFYRLTML